MNRHAIVCLVLLAFAACAGQQPSSVSAPDPGPAATRAHARPFLNMPQTAAGAMPALLSQTGAFADVRQLQPAAGLLPYDLVLAFWSDGAEKSRFVAIPEGKVTFSTDGEWVFPPGTVFVKTFELPVDAAQPQRTRRLETRLLVVDRDGGVYGVTYKWRADLSDAELLPAGLNEDIAVRDAGGPHVQSWYYPSREDCLVCHNSHTKGVLGPKTRQMNRVLRYPDGVTENQLQRWNRLGCFPMHWMKRTCRGLPRWRVPTMPVAASRTRRVPGSTPTARIAIGRAARWRTSMRATRRRWQSSASSTGRC